LSPRYGEDNTNTLPSESLKTAAVPQSVTPLIIANARYAD
jgi:hypothetical protein